MKGQATEQGLTARAPRPRPVNGSAEEMPTIWEDPAGKGYPCFERPMTALEARDTVDRYGRRIAELENALDDQREVYSDDDVRCVAYRWLAKNESSEWKASPLETLNRFIRGEGSAPDGILDGLGFARVIVKVKP